MALDLVVSGATGRMGRAIARLVSHEEDLRLLGGVAREARSQEESAEAGYPEIVTAADAGTLLARAEVVIDVSSPDQLRALTTAGAEPLRGTALVVGTTGLDEAHEARLAALAREGPVLVASNFSVGVTLLEALVEMAARSLPAAEYDLEIVETHHRRKADAPSGTALSLGRAAARGRDARLEDVRRDGRSGRTGERPGGEIGFHSLRGGDVAGEHRVSFFGGLDRIELSHAAASRDLFADGALRAARWLAGRDAGRYEMRQVVGL